MVSVSEASSIILSHLFQPKIESVPVALAPGRILAEPVRADRNLPPFDRVTMDGIAISSEKYLAGLQKFSVQGIQSAGQPQMKIDDPAKCIEVMTGTSLPEGTDTVIPYEDIEIVNGVATLKITQVSKGQNIHFCGSDARANDSLLEPGLRISSAEVSVMASVGKSHIGVYALPSTAIISTGDELVPIDATPRQHQIRQSNATTLQAALAELGGQAALFTVRDEPDKIESTLSEIFKHHELVILSGGVSKGKFDYVPKALESLGIKKLFHSISQRPGKPIWFGQSSHQTVFALPGNPVSTYLCFYRYVRPWLLKSMQADIAFPSAILAQDFSFIPALTYFLQVKIRNDAGRLMAWPQAGGGSGDFANLKDVDGFLELPLDKNTFHTGEVYPFITFRL